MSTPLWLRQICYSQMQWHQRLVLALHNCSWCLSFLVPQQNMWHFQSFWEHRLRSVVSRKRRSENSGVFSNYETPFNLVWFCWGFFCETKLNFEGRTPLFQKEKKKKYWKLTQRLPNSLKIFSLKTKWGWLTVNHFEGISNLQWIGNQERHCVTAL